MLIRHIYLIPRECDLSVAKVKFDISYYPVVNVIIVVIIVIIIIIIFIVINNIFTFAIIYYEQY